MRGRGAELLRLPRPRSSWDARRRQTMTEETIHVCIDRVLTPDQAVDAAERAIEESLQRPSCGQAWGSRATRMELAALTGKLSRTATPRALPGPSGGARKVRPSPASGAICQHHLRVRRSPDAELRVSFSSAALVLLGTTLAIPRWSRPSTWLAHHQLQRRQYNVSAARPRPGLHRAPEPFTASWNGGGLCLLCRAAQQLVARRWTTTLPS